MSVQFLRIGGAREHVDVQPDVVGGECPQHLLARWQAMLPALQPLDEARLGTKRGAFSR